MQIVDDGASAPVSIAPNPEERTQREHELTQALAAARALQVRLELLGDRSTDVAAVHALRDSLARDLAEAGHGG